MRILHLCLANFYIDGYNYQENVLPRIHKELGHEVRILASTETFIDNKALGYIKPGEYILNDGIKIKRIPYRKLLPHIIMKKIRSYKGVKQFLKDYNPDLIFCHSMQFLDMLTVVAYKKNNPNVRLVADSHEDYNNSARNFLSKNVLHKILYKSIILRAYPYVDRLLCVTYEAVDFMNEVYGIPKSKLEFYPLGGEILETVNFHMRKTMARASLNLSDEDIMLLHTGKMNKFKRTDMLIKAFMRTKDTKLRLVLIGSLSNDIELFVNQSIKKDRRIIFLGWENAQELMDYICACDLYMQPGGQSVTMQNAACLGAALALYPHKSHKLLMKNSVFYIETEEDIFNLINEISARPSILLEKKKLSFELAKRELDYRELAKRVLV